MPRLNQPKVTPARIANACLIAERERGVWISRRGLSMDLGVKVTPHLLRHIEAAIEKGWIIPEQDTLRNGVVRWLYRPAISKPVRDR